MEAVLEKSKTKQKKKKSKNVDTSYSSVNKEHASLERGESVIQPNEAAPIVDECEDENTSNISSEGTGEVQNSSDNIEEQRNKADVVLSNETNDSVSRDVATRAIITKVENATQFSDLMQDSSYNTLLQANKELVHSIKLSDVDINEQLQSLKNNSSATKNEQTKIYIRAYTESQLAALYTNSELEANQQFTKQFVEAELKGFATKRHVLYELLENYLQARSKLTGNSLETDQLRQEYKEIHNQIWSLETVAVGGRGVCHDGVTVLASHSYNKAVFHRSVFQTVDRILTSLRKVVTETHVLYSYLVEVSRLQIEVYLQTLLSNCVNASNLQQSAPVVLTSKSISASVAAVLSELRLCISILFSFQRCLIRDVEFIKQSREWLTRLIAVLLRLANWQDHLFILNHVLRCPAGVGSWGAKFVQTPLLGYFIEEPFSDLNVNHIVVVLSTILMPVEQRERFLEQIAQSHENPDDSLWVVVDSEGEEDEELSGTALRENDLVQLLNQLPLDNLFRVTMLIVHRDGEDFYDNRQLTEHHLLRFLAFCTVLLKILKTGLHTYNQARYQQFLKRLCRFIRHIVQYATDQWEQFQKCNTLADSSMLERLQVEYDAFFLRAACYLYIGQKVGAWQFLAVIPYHMISMKTLWKLFYALHDSESSVEAMLDPLSDCDLKEKAKNDLLHNQFEEKLASLDDAESYYLLNALANMALARKESEMDFIKAATLDLLKVGFISKSTQENCCKNARILLTHITSKYPPLLHDILIAVKKNFENIGSYSTYLFEELPLTVWQCTDNDMQLLFSWLKQNEITSDESRLARMILSRLNWSLTSENKLFLPYSLHFKTALMLAEIVEDESGYLQWAWQTAYRLRLHLCDKGFADFSRVTELDNLSVICRGVRDQKPFFCFLALLMTSWGHLVPLVCTKGLPLLDLLHLNYKHDAILFCLNLIAPLFLNCQESLINSDKFQSVLVNLLNADRTYINMAKNLVVSQNAVLEQFGNMIQHQIVNFKEYNLNSPRCLVRLWMNSLVSVPHWNKDHGVLYLLDVILRAAFFHSDAIDAAANVLRDLLQSVTPQEHYTTISSIFKWASQSTTPQGTLLTAASLPTYVWLAYILITLEYEEREKNTRLWNEILTQLKFQKGKVNVDAAIKKAASSLKLPSFTSASLCIYRWAQQAIDTPVDHPLLPLLWQKFFTLYLVRVPVNSATDKGCLGEKFFDGIINLTFLKRLKKRLQETVDFYHEKCESCDSDEGVNSKKQFYENCYKVFKAFSLWLEEPRLQEANLYLPSLPQQYEPQLLALIIQGNEMPWVEYIDSEVIENEKQKCLKNWRISIYREKSNVNQPLLSTAGMESSNPVERILRRLSSYDSPKAPPSLVKPAPVIPEINLTKDSPPVKLLQPHFQTVSQFARNHHLRVSEHKALDSTYKELIPQLYRSVMCKVRKQVVCKGTGQTACTGAGVVNLEMQEARINERVDHQVQSNRNDYELMLSKSLQTPAQSICIASVTIQKLIEMLQIHTKSNMCSPEIGVELFYHILSLMTEEICLCPPTKQLYQLCLEKLGQAFICGMEYETPRLLSKILQEPSSVHLLAPHFLPLNVGTTNFLHMYSTICNDAGQRYDIVFSLLSKFDIPNWLNSKQPKLIQRNEFIELVVKGLTLLNFEPAAEALFLHEIYRKHLLFIFEYQFPEHYGDVLTNLLKVSSGGNESGCIAVSVWMDVFNSLSKPLKLKLNIPMRDQLRQYAQQQKLLSYQELLETSRLLATYFASERLQYGLYGLYPKYRNYIDAFVLLLGMTGHAIIISSLNTHQGVLGDKLCEIIWPYIRDMFAPWVLPYWMQNVKESMATWMQNLTDDRAVLLPWIAADGAFAQKMIQMMFECVQFIVQTLPACNNILSFIWHWYITNFAHAAVKEHILNAIHASFLALPWHNFWPSVSDLELMLKVVEQYLPECHVFLGHIFMESPWTNWIRHISANATMPVVVRVHQCLLFLLVKLSNEPNVRATHSNKARALLIHAESFNWALIEPSTYQQIVDWYVLSYDPLVLCVGDQLNLDYRVLNFLKVVAHYHEVVQEPAEALLQKRHVYVRGIVKMVSVLTSKYKSTVKLSQLKSVIGSHLSHLSNVVRIDQEMNVLLSELLSVLSIDTVNKSLVSNFEQWISAKCADDIALTAVFRTTPFSVTDNEIVAQLLETGIQTYFGNNSLGGSEVSWRNLIRSIRLHPPRQAELEHLLIVQGKLLTLHAVLLQKVVICTDSLTLANTVLQWLQEIKVNTSVEDKLPLLWSQLLYLAQIQIKIEEPTAGTLLYKFAQLLLQTSNEKGISGWGKGLLGAIGIVKQDSLSLKYRFLCRALAGYMLAQLPESKGSRQTIRNCANAPATVGQPGGNTECVKVLLGLDFGQSQGEIKNCAEAALKQIQDPANSLHNSRKFLSTLVGQLYIKPYLKDMEQF